MSATPFPDRGQPPGPDHPGPLLAAFPAGMGVLDLDLHWREVNPALASLLHAAPDALRGQPLAAVVEAADWPGAQLRLRALTQGQEESARLTLRWRGADGETFRGEALLGLVRDSSRRPQAVLMQLRSLDEERAALDRARRQLQLITDAVSHDLRAPLRAIESFSARLAERYQDALDEVGRDHLARIRAAAERMNGLLAALSDFVRAGRAELRPTVVDVSLLAEWACMALRDRHPGREAQVEIQPGLTAFGDERLLQLMLERLLENAWRFARPDAPVRVVVRGERAGDRLHLRVHDAGIGFDMQFAHKLFEPFQRLHGPEQGGGHGLGLAIAHRVVERHGGRIRAESAPQAGTTLHVELPAEPRAMDATE